MRLCLLALVALLVAGCPPNGPCCVTKDCPGGNICSVTDCSQNHNIGGYCESRCQVDYDCNDPNKVCVAVEPLGSPPGGGIGVVCGCQYKGADAGCGSCSGCLGH